MIYVYLSSCLINIIGSYILDHEYLKDLKKEKNNMDKKKLFLEKISDFIYLYFPVLNTATAIASILMVFDEKVFKDRDYFFKDNELKKNIIKKEKQEEIKMENSKKEFIEYLENEKQDLIDFKNNKINKKTLK